MESNFRSEPAAVTRTILIAEDQRAIRALAGSALRRHGYQVLEATDGVEALELVANHPGPIDLVVTDWNMPRMGGAELCTRLGDHRPETRILIISGFLDMELRPPSAPFLPKPFTPLDLVRRVGEVLATS